MIPQDASPDREKELANFQRTLKKDMQFIQEVVAVLERQGDYSTQDFINFYQEQVRGLPFCEYLNQRTEALYADNRFSTANVCQCAGINFSKFLGGRDIKIEEITLSLMKAFEKYLVSKKKSKNTIASYLRSLRATYNQAICENKFLRFKEIKENPFFGVFTGNAKTKKRAISAKNISRLAEIKPENIRKFDFDPALQLSIDVFMFSFFTQGMPFVDVANLKKKDIRGEYIQYNRQKTGQPISIELEDCMKQIIDRYADKNSELVFPMLRGIGEEKTKWIKTNSELAKYNRNLKKLAKEAGIDAHLTSYVSRHSWASVASQKGIPIATISRGMGHESEKTTRIYISQLNCADVGSANRQIIAEVTE